jgi:hypothetical protein
MDDFNHLLCVKIIMIYSKIKNISDKDNIAKILYIDNTSSNVKTKILNNLRKTIKEYDDIVIYKDYFDIPKLFFYIFLKFVFDLKDNDKLALKPIIRSKDDLYSIFHHENIAYEHSFKCQFDLMKKGIDEFDLAPIFEYPKVQLLFDNIGYPETKTLRSSLLD